MGKQKKAESSSSVDDEKEGGRRWMLRQTTRRPIGTSAAPRSMSPARFSVLLDIARLFAILLCLVLAMPFAMAPVLLHFQSPG